MKNLFFLLTFFSLLHVNASETWRQVRDLAPGGPTSTILSLAWLPNSNQLISGRKYGQVAWHDTAERTQKAVCVIEHPDGIYDVNAVGCLPEDDSFYASTYRGLYKGNLETGQVERIEGFDDIKTFACSNDGKLVVASKYGLDLYDETLSKIGVLSENPARGPVAFSSDGLQIANMAGKILRVWDVRNSKNPLLEKRVFETLPAREYTNTCMTCYSDSGTNTIALGSNYSPDGERNSYLIQIIDTDTGEVSSLVVGGDGVISSLDHCPDDNRPRLAFALNKLGSGYVGLCDLTVTDPTKLLKQTFDDPYDKAARVVKVSPDGSTLAAAVGSIVTCWQYKADFAQSQDSQSQGSQDASQGFSLESATE